MSVRALTIVVTGGAGFIGSAVVRQLVRETGHLVVNIDKLTYAGNLESLGDAQSAKNYRFEEADVCDGSAMARLFESYRPDAVMHLAAESHVDRSIDGPAEFIETNILGNFTLLECARAYCEQHISGALRKVLIDGTPGEVYCIGGDAGRANIAIVEAICDLLDRLLPGQRAGSYRELISFVEDRPGHDRRYAMDIQDIAKKLDWRPSENFESGLENTARWYLENEGWCGRVRDGSYRGERFGLMGEGGGGG